MRCTAKKRLRRRGRERQRPAGAGEGQPARPARRPGRPLRRAGALRPARDGRPRPARPPGAPARRGVRGGRPPRPGLAAVDRLRGPGHAPDLAQGHPHRAVGPGRGGRPLRLPGPAGRRDLRAGGPGALGHREPGPPRARSPPARGRQPHPAQARHLRPVALLRAQHPARRRRRPRERGGLRQRPQPRPSPRLRSSQIRELNSPALNLGQSKGTGSIAVYVDGRLAGSAGQQTKRYDLKSSTKSFGALLLCLALDDHKVTLSSKGADFVPDFGQPSAALAGSVTVKELATHTAGFDKAGGFVPIKYKPGTAFAYSDGGANWLTDVLTSAYHQDMAALFRSRIGSKLDISIGWRSNQYRPPTLNGVPRREFGSGITASVEAMGRVGVMLQHGGAGVISPGCGPPPRPKTTPGVPGGTPVPPGASKHYGLLWWNNNDGAMSGVPRDAFWSWGLALQLHARSTTSVA